MPSSYNLGPTAPQGFGNFQSPTGQLTPQTFGSQPQPAYAGPSFRNGYAGMQPPQFDPRGAMLGHQPMQPNGQPFAPNFSAGNFGHYLQALAGHQGIMPEGGWGGGPGNPMVPGPSEAPSYPPAGSGYAISRQNPGSYYRALAAGNTGRY